MWHNDTVVIIKPAQLKTLNQQIALLSEYKTVCDSALLEAGGIIIKYKLNEADYKTLLHNKDTEIQLLNEKAFNLAEINRKQKKKGLKTTLYSSGGAAVIGLILGFAIGK